MAPPQSFPSDSFRSCFVSLPASRCLFLSSPVADDGHAHHVGCAHDPEANDCKRQAAAGADNGGRADDGQNHAQGGRHGQAEPDGALCLVCIAARLLLIYYFYDWVIPLFLVSSVLFTDGQGNLCGTDGTCAAPLLNPPQSLFVIPSLPSSAVWCFFVVLTRPLPQIVFFLLLASASLQTTRPKPTTPQAIVLAAPTTQAPGNGRSANTIANNKKGGPLGRR